LPTTTDDDEDGDDDGDILAPALRGGSLCLALRGTRWLPACNPAPPCSRLVLSTGTAVLDVAAAATCTAAVRLVLALSERVGDVDFLTAE
jgi:hypothetical protein